MKKILAVLAALFFGAPAYGQQVNLYCQVSGGSGFNQWQPCSSANKLAVDATFSGGVTVTNPSTGAAVPATANYVAINVGGTLTGFTGGTTAADNVTAPTGAGDIRSFNYVWDGSAWDRLPGTSTAGVTVSGAGTAGTAAAGVVTVQGVASMTPVQVSQATASNLNGLMQPVAGATGGSTVSSAIAPATPAGVNLKASAGTLYGLQATTIQSTPVYVKFYNSASAPTCGSGTPVARYMVPAASTANIGGRCCRRRV